MKGGRCAAEVLQCDRNPGRSLSLRPRTDRTHKKHKGGGNTVETLERRDRGVQQHQTVKKISETAAMALYTTDDMSPTLEVTNIY